MSSESSEDLKMTEHEYIIEMLCCTPIELLESSLEGDNDKIPKWLTGIPKEAIKDAIERYYWPTYAKKRAEMLKYI